jgi:hypothetical protein
LNICTVILFSKKKRDLSCVCINYVSEENWFPLVQGFQYTTDSSGSNNAGGDK